MYNLNLNNEIVFIMNRLAKYTSKIFPILALTGCAMIASAQEGHNKSFTDQKTTSAYRLRETPRLALSTNMLHNLTTSMNLGIEAALWRKMTLDLPVTLNPWTYDKQENNKFKFILFQPELRFWTCEAFNGHFFGIHGHYAYYNAQLPFFPETMNQNRFEGQLMGAGISYGMQLIIGKRWGMELTIGAGYAKLSYNRYPCQSCAKQSESETQDYWGVTRAGLKFVYYIF